MVGTKVGPGGFVLQQCPNQVQSHRMGCMMFEGKVEYQVTEDKAPVEELLLGREHRAGPGLKKA